MKKENKEKECSNTELTQIKHDDNKNIENEEVVNGEENKNEKKTSFGKIISANILDQLILFAGAAVLILIIDFILRMIGYRFTKENGGIAIASCLAYFVLNCIYTPIMGKTKMNNTIAKKILNI